MSGQPDTPTPPNAPTVRKLASPSGSAFVVCYQCGKKIARGKVWYRGEKRYFMPLFCSRKCGVAYDETKLTAEKLSGMIGWLPDACRPNSELLVKYSDQITHKPGATVPLEGAE